MRVDGGHQPRPRARAIELGQAAARTSTTGSTWSPIELPALRDRIEDLPGLIGHFVTRCNERLGKEVTGFSQPALDALSQYAWPGNIRELENLVERMVLFASERTIDVGSLPEPFTLRSEGGDDEAEPEPAPAAATDPEPQPPEPGDPEVGQRLLRLPLATLGLDLKEAVRAGSRLVEEALISEALAQTQGNVTPLCPAAGGSADAASSPR